MFVIGLQKIQTHQSILNNLFATIAMSYSIQNLSKKQLEVIIKATDLLRRVQLGQWDHIIEHVPLKEDVNYDNLYNTKRTIAQLLSEYMVDNIDGIFGSLGMGNENLPESTAIATDIHDVIRYKLSWENAVKDGIIANEEEDRRWPEMLGVNYDEPFHWSKEDLPVIEKTS